jgi:hypothetical protein
LVSRIYVFADEAGNFDFSRNRDASKYFILTTVTATDCAVGDALAELRRTMSWEGYDLPEGFHARHDPKPRRARVFGALAPLAFRVDATIIEKAKAMPKIRPTTDRFYQYAWYLHFKYVAPQIAGPKDELHVVAATLETKAKRARFHAAVKDVVRQVSPVASFKTDSWAAATDPCLQAADYACWAVGRKWEHGDPTALGLMAGKVRSEFPVFKHGTKLYY